MSNYVYWRSEPQLWTVGYIEPDGSKQPESDHDSPAEAAKRVHYLNGGTDAGLVDLLKKLNVEMKELIKGEIDEPSVGIVGWNSLHDLTKEADAIINQK